MNWVSRDDSARFLAAGEDVQGHVDPAQVIRLTIHVKPADDHLAGDVESRAIDPLRSAPPLTREQYAQNYGAKPQDIRRIRQFARRYGLEIVPDALADRLQIGQFAHRAVEVAARVRNVNRAFGIKLIRVRGTDGNLYRTYLGPYSVPSDFQDVIANVLGLDTRPQVVPRTRPFARLGGTETAPTSYTPVDVAKAYQFPTHVTGKGQTIAILEMGGGYRMRDLRRYFRGLGLLVPRLQVVSVGRARNAPTGNPNGPDSEVMLDIEVAGAVANGASFVVYFAGSDNRSFLRAVNAAVHDNVHRPGIISISWGNPEGKWTRSDMFSINEALQAAALMGLSVFTAAGDSGSTDGVPGRLPHVDFPASSPWATACGGTSMPRGAQQRVWNDGDGGGTGGGISETFSAPNYQQVAVKLPSGALTMRGVPDVAGCADPNTGYQVRIDGANTVYGGTSAVAPLWAGLTALLNEDLGRPVGFLNPLIYLTTLKGALTDIVLGDNDTTDRLKGVYPARPGWDACTGLGTPIGLAMLAALRP